jgi:hypothetical protein
MEILWMMLIVPCTEEPEEHHRSRAKAHVEHSSLGHRCCSPDGRAQFILVVEHRRCRTEQEVEGPKI